MEEEEDQHNAEWEYAARGMNRTFGTVLAWMAIRITGLPMCAPMGAGHLRAVRGDVMEGQCATMSVETSL